MKTSRSRAAIDLIILCDRSVTLFLNRTLRWPSVCTFFTAVSCLGNGRFWYALLGILPVLHGHYGFRASLHMSLTALVTLVVYKAVKGVTQRPRPGAVHAAILQGTIALDEYSFPSGHTMHATAFSVIAIHWFPALEPLLLTFTVLVALSRIVLGLHYPTDVFLGALFGFLISGISLSLCSH
jgi:undecaprenyl-diphosphatase